MSDRDALKSALAATPECLTPAQLESLLDGKHNNPHLVQCPRCQAELAMLKSFESGAPLPDEGAAVAWISSHLGRQLEEIKNPSRGRLSRPTTQFSEPRGSWLARMFGVGNVRWVLPVTALAAIAIASAGMHEFMAHYAHSERDAAGLADYAKIADIASFVRDVIDGLARVLSKR